MPGSSDTRKSSTQSCSCGRSVSSTLPLPFSAAVGPVVSPFCCFCAIFGGPASTLFPIAAFAFARGLVVVPVLRSLTDSVLGAAPGTRAFLEVLDWLVLAGRASGVAAGAAGTLTAMGPGAEDGSGGGGDAGGGGAGAACGGGGAVGGVGHGGSGGGEACEPAPAAAPLGRGGDAAFPLKALTATALPFPFPFPFPPAPFREMESVGGGARLLRGLTALLEEARKPLAEGPALPGAVAEGNGPDDDDDEGDAARIAFGAEGTPAAFEVMGGGREAGSGGEKALVAAEDGNAMAGGGIC